MTTRDSQIERVVEILTDEFDGGDSDWYRFNDLTLFPIANDLNEEDTDALIRAYLKEEPVKKADESKRRERRNDTD